MTLVGRAKLGLPQRQNGYPTECITRSYKLFLIRSCDTLHDFEMFPKSLVKSYIPDLICIDLVLEFLTTFCRNFKQSHKTFAVGFIYTFKLCQGAIQWKLHTGTALQSVFKHLPLHTKFYTQIFFAFQLYKILFTQIHMHILSNTYPIGQRCVDIHLYTFTTNRHFFIVHVLIYHGRLLGSYVSTISKGQRLQLVSTILSVAGKIKSTAKISPTHAWENLSMPKQPFVPGQMRVADDCSLPMYINVTIRLASVRIFHWSRKISVKSFVHSAKQSTEGSIQRISKERKV